MIFKQRFEKLLYAINTQITDESYYISLDFEVFDDVRNMYY